MHLGIESASKNFSMPWVLVAVAVLTVSACSSDNDDIAAPIGTEFSVELSSDQEVPALEIAGASGIADLTIDTDTGAASGTVTVSGLTGEVAAAHIHSGFAGENGAVLFPLDADAANNLVWSVPAGTTLDAPALAALANGGLYINVHTAANAGGEIRGQIIPAGVRVIRTALSGVEEVPAVTTSATATAVLTVNDNSREIWATVRTNGLDDATMAHIHAGDIGANGGVVTGFEQDAADVSVWRSVAGTTLTAEDLASLDSSGLYYNVHTPAQPAGEVRGQIRATQFTVRIENVSNGDTLATSDGGSVAVPLSPGVYLVHRESFSPLLEPRNPAGPALEALAEDGNAALFPAEITGSVVFNTPAGASSPGPLFPGDYYTFTFNAAPGDKLSLATMFVQSNDWFYTTTDADDSIELFNGNEPVTGDVSGQLALWETETELDEEPGLGPNQAPRQSGPNTGTAEVGTVGGLAGKGKSVTLNGSVISVTLTAD